MVIYACKRKQMFEHEVIQKRFVYIQLCNNQRKPSSRFMSGWKEYVYNFSHFLILHHVCGLATESPQLVSQILKYCLKTGILN